jgi:hypothetical protein
MMLRHCKFGEARTYAVWRHSFYKRGVERTVILMCIVEMKKGES